MPIDTARLVRPDAGYCDSPSLYLDRFADPGAKDSGDCHPRRDWFRALCKKDPWTSAVGARQAWLSHVVERGNGQLLYAQLQSRLMVNMAGGVMENAGLCLDRFGLPYVPGTAVKGCARRAAIHALLEAESAEAKAELLFTLAIVFGWGDTDWRSGRKSKHEEGREVATEPHSDFWWSMAPDTGERQHDDELRNLTWGSVAIAVANRLLSRFEIGKREHPDEPWRDLPNFGGTLSFLPAHPVDLDKTGKVEGLTTEVPQMGKLELDVVTCHHRAYYEGRLQTATDTEEPVPVVFPAVAPGHVFAFALAPLRGADSKLIEQARAWLQTGLETFGLGAKTNAGYGWFQDVTPAIRAAEKTAQEQADILATRLTLQPDLVLIETLRAMKEPDLRGQINPFATEERFWTQKDERFQFTILYFLTVVSPEVFPADRTNPKSKIAKAIANLAAKFSQVKPPQP